MSSSCVLCSHAESDPFEIYRDQWWAAAIFPGFEVPGWYVLRLLRHAEGLAAMRDAEAEALGPALRRVSSAISTVCRTDVVYATCYGEDNRHLHLLVTARPDTVPAQLRRGRLADMADQLVDAADAIRTAAEVQELLRTQDGETDPH